MTAAKRPDTDRGFTLIEVIITTVLLGLVMTVISAAVIVIFRSEAGVVRLTSESHDTQQGVNYFPLDVQAGPLLVGDYITGATTGCGAGGDNVLEFVKGTKLVTYRTTDLGSTSRLDRHICDAVGFGNLDRVNIADRLDNSGANPVVVTVLPDEDQPGLVQSITLRFAQDGDDVTVVASPRGEPLGSPGDCQTDNPIEASHGYGVFVEGDVLLFEGTVTGWLGLGGAVTWLNDTSVATNNMSAVSPAFGLYASDVDWSASTRKGSHSIERLTVASNVATATVASTHGYSTGDTILVESTGDANIDGNYFTITVVDADTFTFPVTTANTTVPLRGIERDFVFVPNIDVVSNVATVTAPGHGQSTGDRVLIDATGDADIDTEVFTISVLTSDTFRFMTTAVDTTGLTGFGREVVPSVLEVGHEDVALGTTTAVELAEAVYESVGSGDNFIDMTGSGNPDLQTGVSQVVFAADFNELRDCSAQLANLLDICVLDGCAKEVVVTVGTTGPPYTVDLCMTGPTPQVVNVPESFLRSDYEFDRNCQGAAQSRPLLINVIADDTETPSNEIVIDTSTDWTALGDRKNILFNFPNADRVIVSSPLFGQILAPFAHVETYDNVSGGVIAQQWTHHTGTVTSHFDLFDNEIDWP